MAKDYRALRVRPKRGSCYYVDVKVFRTRALMQARRPWGHSRHFYACFYYHPGKWARKLGEIHFYERGFTSDVIAHECVHAAMEYLKRLGQTDLRSVTQEALPYLQQPEEMLCHAVQWMVRELERHLELRPRRR